MKVKIQELSIELLIPTPDNPRTDLGDIESLAADIKHNGVLQPLTARPCGWSVTGRRAQPRDRKQEGKFVLIFGNRRLAAAKVAGLGTVPVIVRKDVDEATAAEMTVSENLQREDLSPLEEARGIQILLQKRGWDAKAVGAAIGRPESWVHRRERLTKLIPEWWEALSNNAYRDAFPASWIELIAAMEPASQLKLLEDHTIGRHCRIDDLLSDFDSTAELQKFLQRDYLGQLGGAPWSLDDAVLYPQAGSCVECSKRDGCRPMLFDEVSEDKPIAEQRCLDTKCWQEKAKRTVAAKAKELKAEHGRAVLIKGDYGQERNDATVKGFDVVRADGSSWSAVKKGTAGAVPGVVISPAGLAQVKWVKKGQAQRGSGAAKKPKAQGKKRSAAAILAERSADLEARRKRIVIDRVQRTLDDSIQERIGEDLPNYTLMRLLLVFGTDGVLRQRHLDDWQQFEATSVESDDALRNRLLESVCHVLAGRLYCHNFAMVPETWAEVEQIAKVFPIDLKTLLAEAAEELPEPTSFRRLRDQARAEKKNAKAKPAGKKKAKSKKPKKAAGKASKKRETPAARAMREIGVCRKCGCTEDNACPGGCFWVKPDLCSACATPKQIQAATRKRGVA